MVKKGYDIQIFPCGFVTQPDYFWSGATPDAKVRYRSQGNVTFGIAEVKCPYSALLRSSFTQHANGLPRLNRNHAYFHQVQTELFLTQSPWCDLLYIHLRV